MIGFLEVTKRHPISDQILKVLHAVTFSRAVINSTTLFKSIFTWTSIEVCILLVFHVFFCIFITGIISLKSAASFVYEMIFRYPVIELAQELKLLLWGQRKTAQTLFLLKSLFDIHRERPAEYLTVLVQLFVCEHINAQLAMTLDSSRPWIKFMQKVCTDAEDSLYLSPSQSITRYC